MDAVREEYEKARPQAVFDLSGALARMTRHAKQTKCVKRALHAAPACMHCAWPCKCMHRLLLGLIPRHRRWTCRASKIRPCGPPAEGHSAAVTANKTKAIAAMKEASAKVRLAMHGPPSFASTAPLTLPTLEGERVPPPMGLPPLAAGWSEVCYRDDQPSVTGEPLGKLKTCLYNHKGKRPMVGAPRAAAAPLSNAPEDSEG
jgi:hypothetical protein